MSTNNYEPAMSLHPFASWIDALRPRTLPLALASTLAGGFLAVVSRRYSWSTIVLAVATSLLLQILSNLANDYGDAVKGTDNEHRAGPTRAVQSGRITRAQMKGAIVLCSSAGVLSGSALLYAALGDRLPLSLIFFALGIAAIAAAIRYTIGAKAYGYKGLGDLFVFFFFGIVGVAGTWFLNTREWRWDILLPATAVGLLSAGVLNLNNMRDIENDRASGKRTVAAFLGYDRARAYHLVLVLGAFVLAAWFAVDRHHELWGLLFLIALPLFVRDLVAILKTRESRRLDPFLKRLTLDTLLFVVLFGAGFLLP